MTLTRFACLLALATSAPGIFADARAQASDERFPGAWASVPLPGQQAAETADPEPVPFPRPVPRRGRSAAAQVASLAREAVAEEPAAAPEPPRTVLAYAGDDRFSVLWEPQQAYPAMNGGVAESDDAAVAVPLPRPAPSQIGALSRPMGNDAASRIAAARFPAPKSLSGDLAALIAAQAQQHGVPLALAHAVIRVESNYHPGLTGRGGPIGLMQIKHGTARGLGFRGTVRELFDPATNLEWGMRYLAGARRLANGDLCGTVLRYQGGHGSVRMTRASTVYCGKVRTYMAAAQ